MKYLHFNKKPYSYQRYHSSDSEIVPNHLVSAFKDLAKTVSSLREMFRSDSSLKALSHIRFASLAHSNAQATKEALLQINIKVSNLNENINLE